MKNSEFRPLLAKTLKDFNAYFGDNVGEYNDEGYKVNYQIVSNILFGGQRTYSIDIDVYSKDDVLIEEIADEIEKVLNYKSKHHDQEDSWCTFLLDGRYSNDDKNDYRRTLTYEVRTYAE